MKPEVHGLVAGLRSQVAGYLIVKPCIPDVNCPLKVGAAVAEGDTLGAPTPPVPFEPRKFMPMNPTATTATAATASFAKVFMVGNLHGRRTSTRRCCVRCTSSNAASKT